MLCEGLENEMAETLGSLVGSCRGRGLVVVTANSASVVEIVGVD